MSRTITAVLPLLDAVLAGFDDGLVDIGPVESLLVDGTLIPTGRRAECARLDNGKHKTHGVNVQVLCTFDGLQVWASPPMPGADHDITCFRAHHLTDVFNARTGIADAGYQGHATTGLITPLKRRHGYDLSDEDQAFNTQLAQLRAPVERVNAWLKTFKILTARYRRTCNQLELTIRTTFRILRYRETHTARDPIMNNPPVTGFALQTVSLKQSGHSLASSLTIAGTSVTAGVATSTVFGYDLCFGPEDAIPLGDALSLSCVGGAGIAGAIFGDRVKKALTSLDDSYG